MASAPVVADRSAQLIEALWADKELGAAVRKRAKEAFPDIIIPEDQIDPIVTPLRAELDSMRKDLADERAAREADRTARETEQQRVNMEQALANARTSYNLTDDGFDKMVARMKTTGNYTDADAAAAWVAQQTPAVNVSKADYLPRKLDFLGSANERSEADFQLLHRDPDGYMDAQLQRFADDPDAYVRETEAMTR